MIRKKSSFLVFCFSFMPGAGQMYMGFMKRGVSLMSAFILDIFFSIWLSMGSLLFALPVIWFFAFFDTFNLHGMPNDEFYAMEDEFLVIPKLTKNSKILQGKYRTVLALVMIVIGFSILWNNLFDLFSDVLPEAVKEVIQDFGHYFPQLVVGTAIILLGIYLINGKKKELDSADKIFPLEDKGGFRQ